MAQKEISCQSVSARMMDLLYGELSGDERATIEAHLAGCPSCRAELAAFQGTRTSARRALDADEPPARAHQAILRAAAAAVAAKQPRPIEARSATPHPSFWERWRARWTLPTFATLGAVAVVVLASKVFLEPDKTVELGRQALQSAPAETPAAPPTVVGPQPTGKLEPKNAPNRLTGLAEKQRKDEARPRLQPASPDKATARSTTAPATASAGGPGRRFRVAGGTTKGSGSRASRRPGLPTSATFSSATTTFHPGPPAGAPKPAERAFAAPPPPLAEPARRAAPPAKQCGGRHRGARRSMKALPLLRVQAPATSPGPGPRHRPLAPRPRKWRCPRSWTTSIAAPLPDRRPHLRPHARRPLRPLPQPRWQTRPTPSPRAGPSPSRSPSRRSCAPIGCSHRDSGRRPPGPTAIFSAAIPTMGMPPAGASVWLPPKRRPLLRRLPLHLRGAEPDQSSRRSTWNGETASGSASHRKTDRAWRYSPPTAWANAAAAHRCRSLATRTRDAVGPRQQSARLRFLRDERPKRRILYVEGAGMFDVHSDSRLAGSARQLARRLLEGVGRCLR